MSKFLSEKVLAYIEEHRQYLLDMTVELAKIPAPSNKEELRAAWVKDYFDRIGAKGAYIDEALNVVLELGCEGKDELTVIMAHTDVVFPDMTELPLVIEDGLIKCPGIGDDTANLTVMLLMVKYIVDNNLVPNSGIVFVANSGEEGLGNLKGSRQIMKSFEGRVKEFISFDGTFGFFCDNAVGSHRYNVTIKTEGGHSYGAFGNRNAIHYAASMIDTLYTMKAPAFGKTTYNVGIISGGTSVNTIAQNCSVMYEYRSDDLRGLDVMEKFFNNVIETYRAMGIQVEVEVLGKRPCKGDVPEGPMAELVERGLAASKEITGFDVKVGSGSTDCNIPLSMGIPAICFGVCDGGGAHTREEWITVDSLQVGAKLAAEFILHYFA